MPDGNCPYNAALILQLALAAFNAGLLYGLSMERWVVGIGSGLGSVVLCIIEVKKIYDASDILGGRTIIIVVLGGLQTQTVVC